MEIFLKEAKLKALLNSYKYFETEKFIKQIDKLMNFKTG